MISSQFIFSNLSIVFGVIMNKVIITVIGPDKPGIIASVSDILFKHHGNIENISQTILQSEFACICVASMPDSTSLDTLSADMLGTLNPLGLHVLVKSLGDDGTRQAADNTEPFIISTCGPDQKGLVAHISKIIADFGVNISNLKAVFEGGSSPDRNIMIFEVDIPPSVDLTAFSNALRQEAETLNLDVTVQHKNIFDAVNRI